MSHDDDKLPPFPYPTGKGLEAKGYMLARALDGGFWIESPSGEGAHLTEEFVGKWFAELFEKVF